MGEVLVLEGAEIAAQRLNIVNVKLFDDLGGEVFQVHARKFGIAIAISRGVDVSPKRVRGHGNAVAWRTWEFNVRLGVGRRVVIASGESTASSERRRVGKESTSCDQAHGRRDYS